MRCAISLASDSISCMVRLPVMLENTDCAAVTRRPPRRRPSPPTTASCQRHLFRSARRIAMRISVLRLKLAERRLAGVGGDVLAQLVERHARRTRPRRVCGGSCLRACRSSSSDGVAGLAAPPARPASACSARRSRSARCTPSPRSSCRGRRGRGSSAPAPSIAGQRLDGVDVLRPQLGAACLRSGTARSSSGVPLLVCGACALNCWYWCWNRSA